MNNHCFKNVTISEADSKTCQTREKVSAIIMTTSQVFDVFASTKQ